VPSILISTVELITESQRKFNAESVLTLSRAYITCKNSKNNNAVHYASTRIFRDDQVQTSVAFMEVSGVDERGSCRKNMDSLMTIKRESQSSRSRKLVVIWKGSCTSRIMGGTFSALLGGKVHADCIVNDCNL
jgi:hypothetical protein